MVMFHSYVSLPGGINAGETLGKRWGNPMLPNCPIFPKSQICKVMAWNVPSTSYDELAVKPTNDLLQCSQRRQQAKGTSP